MPAAVVLVLLLLAVVAGPARADHPDSEQLQLRGLPVDDAVAQVEVHHDGPDDLLDVDLVSDPPQGVPRDAVLVLSHTYRQNSDDVGPQHFWRLEPGVSVPDVAGAEPADAGEVLTGLGLSVRLPRTAPGDGTVSRTEPDAGELVPFRTPVVLVVDPVVDTVVVPDVLGLVQEDAERAVRERGLQPVVRLLDGASEDDGRVVQQEPSGGTDASRGDAVVLAVVDARASPGEELVVVPPLVGEQGQDAQSALDRLDLVAVREDVEGTEEDLGLVVGQEPEAGSEVATGTPVSFQVVTVLVAGPAAGRDWLRPAAGVGAVVLLGLLGLLAERVRRRRGQRDRERVLQQASCRLRPAGGTSWTDPVQGAGHDRSIRLVPRAGAARDTLEEVLR